VAERHAELKNKRRDFLYKLSNYYAFEYDLVAVENLDVKGLVELPGNSRNQAGTGGNISSDARIQVRLQRYAIRRRESAWDEQRVCGVSTDKPLWIREHSCLGCGFEADRDANGAWNILSRGITRLLGAGRSKSRPVETALPMDTSISANSVVDTGSSTLKREPSGKP
jgi:putative transposase